jgi:hypothetical protein
MAEGIAGCVYDVNQLSFGRGAVAKMRKPSEKPEDQDNWDQEMSVLSKVGV